MSAAAADRAKDMSVEVLGDEQPHEIEDRLAIIGASECGCSSLADVTVHWLEIVRPRFEE